MDTVVDTATAHADMLAALLVDTLAAHADMPVAA
jgi:hypothetical protein